MKVLVADKFEQSGLDGIRALGAELIYEHELKDDALATLLTPDRRPRSVVPFEERTSGRRDESSSGHTVQL